MKGGDEKKINLGIGKEKKEEKDKKIELNGEIRRDINCSKNNECPKFTTQLSPHSSTAQVSLRTNTHKMWEVKLLSPRFSLSLEINTVLI